jgi:hydroxymethylbilane synthase
MPLMQREKHREINVRLRILQQGQRRGNGQGLRLNIRVQRLFFIELRELRPLMLKTIRIGTRGSRLALWQANWVKSRIEENFPESGVSLVVIKTRGDKILDVPLARVGGKGLFVKEIEEALLDNRVDLAVHSMKDMPAELPPELHIGAVPLRENPNDVLISKNNKPLSMLPAGARIGTSSLRRGSQMLNARPDFRIEPLRGNLETRLRKLKTTDLDAIILAAAGILRMGLANRITEYLDENILLPAVGQGALCIECRKNDEKINAVLETLDHPDTRTVIMGERAFLTRLGGGCQTPIAAFGRLENGRFTLTGMVASVDGKTLLKDTLDGNPEQSVSIGKALGDRLIAMGAQTIIDTLKEDFIKNETR